MAGCVQQYLELIKAHLEAFLSSLPEEQVIKITGYSSDQIRHFSSEGIDRALKHYTREAARKTKKNRSRI